METMMDDASQANNSQKCPQQFSKVHPITSLYRVSARLVRVYLAFS